MDIRFLPHNAHLATGAAEFAARDPHLRRLAGQPLVYNSPLLERLPGREGIFTITGGRQIGKTTLLKQWMARLLHQATSRHRYSSSPAN